MRATLRVRLAVGEDERVPLEGDATYLSLTVDGQANADAGWFYPDPMDAAAEIKDHVAFWKGVEVTA